MSDLTAGQALQDRYRLERPIAAGGMGTVWLARDAVLDRPVAIKVVNAELADDPDYLKRFTREARIAAQIEHPNLVRLYDFGEEDGRPYLVMELVPGGTLLDRLEGGGDLDAEQLLVDLLRGLAAVHQAGVVHRDVKPGNVLLDERGRARLTDFGVAFSQEHTRITNTGMVVGTVKYIAPEVLSGAASTPASDLYGLGVVLRDCGAAGASPAAAQLVERMTDERAAHRPRDAASALRLYEQGGPQGTRPLKVDPSHRPAPPAPGPGGPPRRHRGPAAGAGSRRRARPAKASSRPRPSSRRACWSRWPSSSSAATARTRGPAPVASARWSSNASTRSSAPSTSRIARPSRRRARARWMAGRLVRDIRPEALVLLATGSGGSGTGCAGTLGDGPRSGPPRE